MIIREFPIHLEIESTNRCNLACVMCPHRKMKRKPMDMEWNVFKKIISESRGKAKSSYLHMIGEPLLHSRIVDMINYTSDAGISTSISTNCMLLSEDYSYELLEHSHLDELVLCLDGADEDTYNEYRIGGDFDRVKRNIESCITIRKKLSNCNTSVVLQLIRMKGNDSQVEQVTNEYKQKLEGIGRVWIKEYSRFAGFVDDLNADTTLPRRFKCSKLRTHIAFQSDGDCVICCRDFEKFSVVGNIKNSTIFELWHSKKYNEYRRHFDFGDWSNNPLCKDC